MIPDLKCFELVKKQEKKETSVKKFLNTQAVEKMSIVRLDARGVKGELKGWFDALIAFSV